MASSLTIPVTGMSGEPVAGVTLRFRRLTGSVSGRVTDERTGAALQGARIRSAAFDVLADASGSYASPQVPVGDTDVTASKSGYESQTKRVRV